MKWRWFLPGYLWSLPLTLIGLALCLVYRAHSFRWHEGVLTCLAGKLPNGQTRIWGRPGAQTHGWLMIAADEGQRQRIDLRVHEYTHVKQAFVGGPIYGVLYGLFFLVAWTTKGFGPWHDAYRANPFEKQAYAHGDTKNGWGMTPLVP